MTSEVKSFFQSHSWKEFPDCSAFTKAFLDRDNRLQNCIAAWPDEQQLLECSHRRAFHPDARKLLVDSLSAQYRDSGLTAEMPAGIQSLMHPNTFTICVGHQLCLLGGPSFIWIKIVQLCRLAQSVNANQSAIQIVPVFWLASEDHDVAEISGITVGGKRFNWSTADAGATGKIGTDGIEKVITEVVSSFPHLIDSETIQLIRDAYSCNNLANAWRRLIHRLAGHLGIVVIDGNDTGFKESFSSVIEKELDEGFMFNAMQNQLEELTRNGFEIPVNPRECCLFYLIEKYRSRIVRIAEDAFETADGLHRWSRSEILTLAGAHPERFSPYVLLRPLYQEYILPNLMYLAGPSELSYWLQLKSCFEVVKINFPLLHLRCGLTLISRSIKKGLEKWNLTLPELMQNAEFIRHRMIRSENHFLEHEIKMLDEAWSRIIAHAAEVDVTLKAAAEAELQKCRDSIQRIEGKMIKAEKRKNSELALAIGKLQEFVFPGGNYQERVEGVINFRYAENKSLERIMHQMNPWASEMMVMDVEADFTESHPQD